MFEAWATASVTVLIPAYGLTVPRVALIPNRTLTVRRAVDVGDQIRVSVTGVAAACILAAAGHTALVASEAAAWVTVIAPESTGRVTIDTRAGAIIVLVPLAVKHAAHVRDIAVIVAHWAHSSGRSRVYIAVIHLAVSEPEPFH